jgi:hypothetical protein
VDRAGLRHRVLRRVLRHGALVRPAPPHPLHPAGLRAVHREHGACYWPR